MDLSTLSALDIIDFVDMIFAMYARCSWSPHMIPMIVLKAISAFRNDPEVVSHISEWKAKATNVYLAAILGLLGQPISDQAILRHITNMPDGALQSLPVLLFSLEDRIRMSEEVKADFISILFSIMRKADEIYMNANPLFVTNIYCAFATAIAEERIDPRLCLQREVFEYIFSGYIWSPFPFSHMLQCSCVSCLRWTLPWYSE